MLSYIEKKLSFDEFFEFQKRNGIFSNNSEERFNWLCYDNPYGKTYFYCAYDNEKLVGLEALIPFKMMFENKRFLSALAVFSLVDKKYRNQGIWKKLLYFSQEEAKKNNIKVIWGSPGETSKPILLNHTNWEYLYSIHYYATRLKYNLETTFFKKNLQKISCLIVNLITKIKLIKIKLYLTEFTDQEEEKTSPNIKIFKSNEYLKWRYLKIPDKGYYLKSIKTTFSDKLVGYLSYNIHNDDLYIFDYKIDNDLIDDFILLLKMICYETNCRNIFVSFTNNNPLIQRFKRHLFFQQKNEHLLMANILDKNFYDMLKKNVWDLSIGDEDTKFTIPFYI